MSYSIIIPCYNAEKNLPIILERFSQAITNKDIEAIIVNNASLYNSENNSENQSYGFEILLGLKETKGGCIGWTHVDTQADPNGVIRAFELIEQSQHKEDLFVKGSRKGRSLFNNFFTIGMSFFESLCLKIMLWEVNAQPNVFHKSFYCSWKNFLHDFFVYYLAKKQKLNVKRLPVKFLPRISDQSTWDNSLKDKEKSVIRTMKYGDTLKQTI